MGKRDYDAETADELDLSAGVAKAGGGYVAFGWLLAIAWLGAAGAGLYAAYGLDQLLAAPPVAQAAAGAVIALPALLVLFCAMALREGARGRMQARVLADAAERMLSPSPTAEAEARRLGVSVRGEIGALDRALDQTLQKVREVEAVIARQTMALDSAAAMAQSGARSVVGGLERERQELLQISDELNAQASSIGQAISRHTRLIADAARLAEAEVRAADEALDARLSSFGAAAALISDRTEALTKAAQTSAESALRLETALSTALDSLAQATALTDAAKKSAESATFAANATAGAVRETTLRAVEDAKRAADIIRQEAASVERAGLDAIQRLRDAAADARHPPSDHSRAPSRGVDPTRPEAFTQQGFAQPRPETGRSDAGRTEFGRGEPRRPEPMRPEPMRDDYRSDPPRAEPPRPQRGDTGRPEPRPERIDPRPEARPEPTRADTPVEPSSRWTWKDVLSAIDDDAATPTQARTPASRADEPHRGGSRPDPALDAQTPQDPGPMRGGWGFSGRGRNGAGLDPTYDRFRAAAPDPDAPAPASQSVEGALIAASGVRLHDVFSPQSLERIGARAKNGTQARRRAVREAAPEAVMRLAEHLDESAEARARAASFLRAEGARISELLGRGRASLSSESTRAFLLLDAASA
ncbi:MAG: hypothetical protein KJS97_05875 [Alphaproteobacteria bacterium]|nr:hypothetical protein [Alphaproteobacteria bacterium]